MGDVEDGTVLLLHKNATSMYIVLSLRDEN